MPDLFLQSPFPALAVFLLAFLSDSFLTLYAARLHRAGANEVIVFEGSYELNPRFAAEVDRLRRPGVRYFGPLTLFGLLICAVWFATIRLAWLPPAFPPFLGAVVLPQGPIHIRHIRNLAAFRRAAARDGVAGRIEYSRRFSYSLSSVELLSFSVLYLLLGLLASSSLLLGGSLGTAFLALRSYQASRGSAGATTAK